MKRTVLIIFIILLTPFLASAQTGADATGQAVQDKESFWVGKKPVVKRTAAFSTNLVDWANLGTINLDFALSLSQHFSLQVGGKYNGWNFPAKSASQVDIHNKQMSASLGVRYWPWYVFSGWWVCAKAQYCKFSETGIWRPALDEGTALGAGLSVGYTLMINKHFNIEFGGGFWGGRLLDHTLYCCPECMDIREQGPKNFIAINDLNISLQLLF